jgi:hypothetical protein
MLAKKWPSNDSRPQLPQGKPPINCPCLACSPGFVPLGNVPTTTYDEVIASDVLPFDHVAIPDDVFQTRLDRPPRFAV